jgi:hypothetical protein
MAACICPSLAALSANAFKLHTGVVYPIPLAPRYLGEISGNHCSPRMRTAGLVLKSELIAFFVVFALGCAVGYGVREQKSRNRRRRYAGELSGR